MAGCACKGVGTRWYDNGDDEVFGGDGRPQHFTGVWHACADIGASASLHGHWPLLAPTAAVGSGGALMHEAALPRRTPSPGRTYSAAVSSGSSYETETSTGEDEVVQC